MPSDNVEPCPRCKGTGEIRIEWWVVLTYQDCHEDYGPFDTQAKAEENASHHDTGGRHGYTVSIAKQEMSHSREQ